jgi:hypothetical protein
MAVRRKRGTPVGMFPYVRQKVHVFVEAVVTCLVDCHRPTPLGTAIREQGSLHNPRALAPCSGGTCTWYPVIFIHYLIDNLLAALRFIPQEKQMFNSLHAVELIKLIASDAALRERLEAADAAQRSEIIKSLGYGDLTPSDITAGSAIFASEATGELQDFELDAVAGGDDTTAATTATVTMAFIAAAV